MHNMIYQFCRIHVATGMRVDNICTTWPYFAALNFTEDIRQKVIA